MLIKKCARCGALVPYGVKWCEACKPDAEAEQQAAKAARLKRADKKRADEVTKFYRSKEWLKLSKAYLQSVGYRCERCGRIAECVHHKYYVRRPGGWERRLDWDNLEALCAECHAVEHGRKKQRAPGGSTAETRGRSKF